MQVLSFNFESYNLLKNILTENKNTELQNDFIKCNNIYVEVEQHDILKVLECHIIGINSKYILLKEIKTKNIFKLPSNIPKTIQPLLEDVKLNIMNEYMQRSKLDKLSFICGMI